MSGHTPGPWIVRNGCNIFATDEDGAPEYLAVTGGLSGRDAIERDAANARVMALAPELLTTLKAMITWGEEPDPFSRSARTHQLSLAWEKAREIIAKAERQ